MTFANSPEALKDLDDLLNGLIETSKLLPTKKEKKRYRLTRAEKRKLSQETMTPALRELGLLMICSTCGSKHTFITGKHLEYSTLDDTWYAPYTKGDVTIETKRNLTQTQTLSCPNCITQ